MFVFLKPVAAVPAPAFAWHLPKPRPFALHVSSRCLPLKRAYFLLNEEGFWQRIGFRILRKRIRPFEKHFLVHFEDISLVPISERWRLDPDFSPELNPAAPWDPLKSAQGKRHQHLVVSRFMVVLPAVIWRDMISTNPTALKGQLLCLDQFAKPGRCKAVQVARFWVPPSQSQFCCQWSNHARRCRFIQLFGILEVVKSKHRPIPKVKRLDSCAKAKGTAKNAMYALFSTFWKHNLTK